MAAGPLLARALKDLAVLPAGAHERAVTAPTLLRLQHVLGKKPSRTPEEQEFIVTMQDYWEKMRQEGLQEGLKAGSAVTRARDVLTVLRARGIAVPDVARERILAQQDPELLERWLEKAAVAASVADVIDEPS